MGHTAVWRVLERMIIDFRKKGVKISADVMSRLRSAKTLINVLKADPSRKDTSQKIDEYLLGIESYLVSEGQERFGREYVEGWLERLGEASEKVFEEIEGEARFIPGVPRDQKWIRVKASEELPIEGLKELAGELDLSYDVQPDGCLLICGQEEDIKRFVKRMTTKYGSKTAR